MNKPETQSGGSLKPVGWAVRGIMAWYDCWIGAYWDRAERRLYLLPLPCLGIVIQFPPNAEVSGGSRSPKPWLDTLMRMVVASALTTILWEQFSGIYSIWFPLSYSLAYFGLLAVRIWKWGAPTTS